MSLLKILGTVLGIGRQKSPIAELAIGLREAIKGKEIDPKTALELTHELNIAEANHRSVFVSGWRPAIGWVGAAVIAFNYILAPIMVWLLPESTPPTLDLDALWPVITGMLGIAGMRSYDKKNGKTS